MVAEAKGQIQEIIPKTIEVMDEETEEDEATPTRVIGPNVNCVANLDTLSMFAITGMIYHSKEVRSNLEQSS